MKLMNDTDLRTAAENHGIMASILRMSEGLAWNTWSEALHLSGMNVSDDSVQWTWPVMVAAYNLRESCTYRSRVVSITGLKREILK